MLVVLDSGPLGLLSNPTTTGEPRDIRAWAFRLLDEGVSVVVPEIADYEVRRELIRADKRNGIRRLDELAHGLVYEPLGGWCLSRKRRKAPEIRPKCPPLFDESLWISPLRASCGTVDNGPPANTLFNTSHLGTSHFRRAAELWAEARNRGAPTAHDAALDGDVLLAAQALGLMTADPDTVVVTTNPKHLARFVRAARWRDL